jgi:protein SCO1
MGARFISISSAARRCCSLSSTRAARLPNFCPLVTHNFAVIDRQLAANPALYAKTHLLCVSFDPEHDTPARLRAYGAQYIGSDAQSAFAHWDFAVPTKPELLEMAKYFDVGITHGADDTITHTLSTTLIDAARQGGAVLSGQ